MSKLPQSPHRHRIDVVTMTLRAFVLMRKYWYFFAWACIVPMIGTWLSDQIIDFSNGRSASPPWYGTGPVGWFGASLKFVVFPSLYIVACMRILFYQARGLSVFGVAFKGWEIRFLGISLLLRSIIYVRRLGTQWIYWQDGTANKIYWQVFGIYGVWLLQVALEGLLLLAMVYTADATASAAKIVRQSITTMQGNMLRLMILSLLVHVAADAWVHPAFVSLVFEKGTWPFYAITYVLRYYVGWLVVAIMAYMVFQELHPDTEPHESLQSIAARGGAHG